MSRIISALTLATLHLIMTLKDSARKPSSSLAFPFSTPPKIGAPISINKKIHWCRHQLPFALDHINTWLLEDEGRTVIVDTGIADKLSQDGWNKTLNSEQHSSEISKIIVTHLHPDHIGNAGWLNIQTNASVWMTQAEFLTAQAIFEKNPSHVTSAIDALFRRHGLPANDSMSVAKKGDHYEKLVGSLPTSFIKITDGDQLKIGGNFWRAIIGSGHSPEHLSLYCEEENVLIAGDMLLPRISTNVAVWPHSPDGNPLEEFLTSIDAFQKLPADVLILPSHGLPFVGAHHRVKELQDHHEERLNKILAICSEPQNAFQILPTLFERELDAYQLFFAMGESIAHLNYLWWAGEVSRQESTSGQGVVNFVKQ
ncbi:MBL fold metallo-hydrolase [Burkholderiales bacterium]|nr:MBL fold metallo-hydrolase [Burkholderiales bacterium]